MLMTGQGACWQKSSERICMYLASTARSTPRSAMIERMRCSAAALPGHQHSPLVFAKLQRRSTLSPGLRTRRQNRWGNGPLRDSRSRRRADHRTGCGSSEPCYGFQRAGRNWPRSGKNRAGAGGQITYSTPRTAQWAQNRGLCLGRMSPILWASIIQSSHSPLL